MCNTINKKKNRKRKIRGKMGKEKCKERGKEYEPKRGEERKNPLERERDRTNENNRRMREGQLTFEE